MDRDREIYAQLEPNHTRAQVNFPSSLLNPKDSEAGAKVEIYLDGNRQKGRSLQVVFGHHTIEIVSGGFSIEESFNFEPRQNYTIEPSMGLSIK